ncbi:MAG: hypothetical protein IJU44_09510 [Kiritimatiellae bacterium]|nr:hypothetical protein [Kiritimatiellia bacterium]
MRFCRWLDPRPAVGRLAAGSIAALVFANVSLAAPSVVKIEGTAGSWRLTVNGQDYFAKGGGGGGSKALLREIGGNSCRTWGADNALRDLDEAAKFGHTLMLGFWLGHAKHGFSYLNQPALDVAEREILSTVAKVKDHPALLCYSLGNEMELGEPHPEEMWRFINRVARRVKELDPNHPVGTVVADIWKEKAEQIVKFAPELQYLGLNSYGGALNVGKRWRELGGNLPYFLTEYGPPGAGECGKAGNGMPLEWNSSRKAERYREIYAGNMDADRGKYCLGGYVFTWGNKNEATPTWFGTMLPDGTRLGAVEALAKIWGRPLKNRCPEISDLKVDRDDLAAGEVVAATAAATDPDGDRLEWKWTLVGEAEHYGEAGLGLATSPGWDDAIIEGQGTAAVKVRLPGGGKFRLYAYCFDGRGNAAYANWPLRGAGDPAKRAKPAERVPLPVFDDRPRHWHISGYMGNTSALKIDSACEANPHSGEKCLKVEYSASGDWAGVMWQNPPNDWGKQDGGFNLTKANTLVFWGRGASGGEKVKIFCGGLKDCAFPDSGGGSVEIVLRKEWTRYRIALDGQDLSRIKTGFAFTVSGGPLTFYLDDIEYVWQ